MTSPRLISVLGTIILAGLYLYYPLFFTNSDQDTCAFGEISNSNYEILLMTAKADKIELTWRDDIASAQLTDAYRNLVGGDETLNRKIAAAHALMRSFGSRLVSFKDSVNPNSKAKEQQIVWYFYELDVNRLHHFALFFRTAVIVVSFTRVSTPTGNAPIYEDRIIVHLPTLLDRPYRIEPNERNVDRCPPLPTDKGL